jgi:hypothetical protein
MRAVGGLIVQIDRYAFWLSVVIGLGGWAYIRTRQTPAAFHPAYRRQLRHFFLSCSAAAAALAIVVVSDGALTALQLLGSQLPGQFLIPLFSMAIEIACLVILVVFVRGVSRRAASTEALPNT